MNTTKPTDTAPRVRFSLQRLLDDHNVSQREFARRTGISRYKAAQLCTREYWPLAKINRAFEIVARFRPPTHSPASARYVALEIVAADGEAKSYRAYPHHTRDAIRWALWQGHGLPVYQITAPAGGSEGSYDCRCTCPAYTKYHSDCGSACKHLIALADRGML